MTECEPRGNDLAGRQIGPVATPEILCRQVCAEIIGDDRCTAEGITVVGKAPVAAICRKLIIAGIEPASPLFVYRGELLCLIVRSIGEAAALTVDGTRTAFARWKPFPSAAVSPRIVRFEQAGISHSRGHAKRRRKLHDWRDLFGDAGRPAAFIEDLSDGRWAVFIGNRNVGVTG